MLRHGVYTIWRELSEVPMSSPPHKVLAPSDFMSCSGLVKDKSKGYKSCPESGHTNNSESNLRLMSGVLGTAEHFMAAAGSLRKDKGDEFDELTSVLLLVDQSLVVSQLLLMGTLSNFTLSKRQEIMLDKSPIPEPLKETVVFLSSEDELFGLPLGKLQEEVSKSPQTVKVDVQVSTSQFHSETGPMKKGSGKPLQEISY